MKTGDEESAGGGAAAWDGGDGGSEEPDREERVSWLDLCPVYEAPDEVTAIHVQAFLIGAGLEARIRSAQVPCFDGAFAMAVGYWGHVLVTRGDFLRARALLENWLPGHERR